jgi:nucleotide-binding universal stress UspA family protein
MVYGERRMSAASEAQRKRRILVYYDGSAESTRALDRVVEIASVVPSDVTVVSVAEPLYPAPPYTGYADPMEEERHRRLLENASRSLDAHGIAAEVVEPTGKTADAILDTARERQVQLVVVGSRQRSLVQHLLFDRLADELVGEAAADVLVVR